MATKRNRRVSRITEAAAFLMVLNSKIKLVPTWAWGWMYRSAPEVYRWGNFDGTAPAIQYDTATIEHPGFKCCTHCGEDYLLTRIFWDEDGRRIDGFASICKHCRREKQRSRHARKTNRPVRKYRRALS